MAVSVASPPEGKHYHFESIWLFSADKNTVWEALIDPANWPKWWSGLRASRVTNHHPAGPGSRIQLGWTAPMGYQLNFSLVLKTIDAPNRTTFTAAGDLDGQGSCEVTAHQSGTRVRIIWNVTTSKPWMNRFAILLKPLFSLNHFWLMRSGERGLRRYLSPKRV